MSLLLFTSFIVLVWSALLLAGIGTFSVSGVLGMTVLAAAGMALLLWRSGWSGEAALRSWRSRLLRHLPALCLAAGSLVLTLPPGESILGGWDPGVYVHTALSIQKHKSLQFNHSDLINMPDSERELLTRNPYAVVEPFSGMRLLPNGKVTPQFYHAYPALLAVAAGVGGLRAVLAVNPVLNVFSILAFYALVLGWTRDRRWALGGALLFAFNPTQLWQAGFSTAELLTQLLVLSAFVLLHRWAEKPAMRSTEALLAGAALGLAQLTRYDTLILLVMIVPVLAWFGFRRAYWRGSLLFLGAMMLGCIHAWAHQRWVAPHYRPLGPLVGVGLLTGACLTIVIVVMRPLIERVIEPGRGRLLVLWPVSWVWSGWMSFNWILRPTLFQRDQFCATLSEWLQTLHLAGLMPVLIGPESRSMLYLQAIFGVYGLTLALIGVLCLLWRAKTPAANAWAWGGMGVTLLLTFSPFNDLFMIWVSRRYVPVVIPWLVLGMVYGCQCFVEFVSNATSRVVGRKKAVTGAAVLLPALLLILPASVQVVSNKEWPGLIAWFERLQTQLPRDAAVYSDRPAFGAPLRFIWGYQAFELNRPTPERIRRFDELIEQKALASGHVYVLSTRDVPAASGDRVVWRRLAYVPMRSSIMNHSRTRMPSGSRRRGGSFSIYVVERVQPFE